MSVFAGRLGRFAVSSDGGVTFFNVGRVQDATFNGAQAEIDVTTHDDGQFRAFIPERKDATIDLSMLFDPDDTGQEIVRDSYFSATFVQIRFRLLEETGAPEQIVLAFPTSLTEGSPDAEAATMEMSFRVTGDFSFSAQT